MKLRDKVGLEDSRVEMRIRNGNRKWPSTYIKCRRASDLASLVVACLALVSIFICIVVALLENSMTLLWKLGAGVRTTSNITYAQAFWGERRCCPLPF